MSYRFMELMFLRVVFFFLKHAYKYRVICSLLFSCVCKLFLKYLSRNIFTLIIHLHSIVDIGTFFLGFSSVLVKLKAFVTCKN